VVLNVTCRCEDSEFYVCSFSSAVSPTLNKMHFGIFMYAYEKYNLNRIEWKRSVCTVSVVHELHGILLHSRIIIDYCKAKMQRTSS
jgi:hypothetical protein